MATPKEDKSSKQAVVRDNVQFVGFDSVDTADQEKIKEIVYSEFITLERELKNIKGLKLHFKSHSKGGKTKYSVHMTIEANTGPISVNKMSTEVQWDPVAMVHKLIDKARQEIIHKYKTDSNYRKPYEKGVL